MKHNLLTVQKLVLCEFRGKLICDWLALCGSIRGFEFARGGEEMLMTSCVVAPINGLPVNPFTGQKDDKECRKEKCMTFWFSLVGLIPHDGLSLNAHTDLRNILIASQCWKQ